MGHRLSGCFTDFDLDEPITTPERAREFLAASVAAIGLVFHPDNSFADYVVGCGQRPMFDPELTELLELRLSEAHSQLGDTVYDAAMTTEAWQRLSGC